MGSLLTSEAVAMHSLKFRTSTADKAPRVERPRHKKERHRREAEVPLIQAAGSILSASHEGKLELDKKSRSARCMDGRAAVWKGSGRDDGPAQGISL